MNNAVFRNVSVLMGGISREREVSMRSGTAVAEGLRAAGRNVVEVDVRCREFDLPARIEAVFIALHGAFGEDGGIQEMLEARGIPYTGSGPESSRVAFNKHLAKDVFIRQNIQTPEYEVLRPGQRRTLDLPVVVKPVSQGSSLGVHMVTEESEWSGALADALSYNGEVIVESYIEGKELTVGIVGDDVLPVLEIRAPGNNYDYRAKYSKGVTEYLVPAELDVEASRRCQELAWTSFRSLNCRGFGRADLRMAAGGNVYVLEMNTIPGFTETSLLPKAASAAGFSFSMLCDRIMQMAALD